jgi:hypothetical protein
VKQRREMSDALLEQVGIELLEQVGTLRAENERLQVALRGALAMVEDFASGAGFSPSGRAEFEGYRRALEGK